MDLHSAHREFQSLALADVNNDGHLDMVINGTLSGRDQPNGPDVYLGDGRGGWKASSAGLKVLKFAAAGIALGDLDQDGSLDIVAGGITGEAQSGAASSGSGPIERGDGAWFGTAGYRPWGCRCSMASPSGTWIAMGSSRSSP